MSCDRFRCDSACLSTASTTSTALRNKRSLSVHYTGLRALSAAVLPVCLFQSQGELEVPPSRPRTWCRPLPATWMLCGTCKLSFLQKLAGYPTLVRTPHAALCIALSCPAGHAHTIGGMVQAALLQRRLPAWLRGAHGVWGCSRRQWTEAARLHGYGGVVGMHSILMYHCPACMQFAELAKKLCMDALHVYMAYTPSLQLCILTRIAWDVCGASG